MTRLLVELHLDGPTRLEEFAFPRKTQPACQIEVRVEFPADGRVLGGRGARIFLVFLSCQVRLTRCTAGDSCEQITYDALHGNSSLGLGPSES